MCSGRSMNFDPSSSARRLTAGPRSSVTTETSATATAMATTSQAVRAPRTPPRVTGRSPASRHAYSTTASTAPASTDCPSVTATDTTRPAWAARSSFSIFIASTTTSPCRAADRVAGRDQHAHHLAGHRRQRPAGGRRRPPPRRCAAPATLAGAYHDGDSLPADVDIEARRRRSAAPRPRSGSGWGRRRRRDRQAATTSSSPTRAASTRYGVPSSVDPPPVAVALHQHPSGALADRHVVLQRLTSAPRRAPGGSRRLRRPASPPPARGCRSSSMQGGRHGREVERLGARRAGRARRCASASFRSMKLVSNAAGQEVRVVQHPAEERDGGLDADARRTRPAPAASAPARGRGRRPR